MENQDEVRTLLLSLLISRKDATSIVVLERDYYNMEKKRIPYRKFGYNNLVQFLQSMPEHFVVEESNGGHYIRGIADKSKHVSSLVSRQRNSSNKNLRTRHSSRQATTFNRRTQHARIPVRIPNGTLIDLINFIKTHPNGMSLQNALLYIQAKMQYVPISHQDLRAQLHEVTHQLCIDGNMIYAVRNDLQSNVAQQPSNQQPLMEESSMQLWNESELPDDSISPPTQQTECPAGEEDFELDYFDDEDEDYFVSPCSKNNIDNCQRRPKTSEMLATNLAQHAKSEQTDMFNYSKSPDNNESFESLMMNSNYTEMRATEYPQDKSEIVSDRIKARLKKLLQKYPDGIWCAELPDIYLKEYKVHLNYSNLGFTSVREFTSYLPKIFYMTQVNKTDDFKLYSADKRPVVPKAESINKTSHNHQYDEHRTARYNNFDDDPIPSEISSSITKKFAPDGVMNYGDDVGKILVTDLKRTKKFLETYVVEVFHPNFFWIQLRENKKRFNKMMDELQNFYILNKDKYVIAKVALKKDLNCACVFDGNWHRGIIKSVKPDFRVTIFFYDFGTLKAYAAEDIYYLHSKFSYLPAQAIPCGLYNVKPNVGDRWKRSVYEQFYDKVSETLLAATIITVDPPNNSMLVVLTDTSEEEDVCINNWLVKEKLAQFGKTVRINDIKNFMMFDFDSAPSIRTRRKDSVNKPRHCRDQSILHDERTHVLSNVKSEDKKTDKKTVKSSHKLPDCKKKVLELFNKSPDAKFLHVKSPSVKSTSIKSLDAKSPDTSLDANSSDTKSLDAKLQSSNSSYSQNGRSKTPKEFKEVISMFKKLERSKLNGISSSNSNTSISEANTDNENNVKQIDSSKKKESRYSIEDCSMNFNLRNSDDENDQNDFGTFRSLYGGHGLMEPIDWSVIREENNLAHKTVTPMRECKSDAEDKSGSHNQRNELQRHEVSGKQYFLDLTSLEKENFLPEDNIDYDAASDFLDMLKDNTVSNHTVTVMFTPNVKLKTLHNSRSEDTNPSINIIELNDMASSKEMDQKVDRNGKVCNGKIRADQKIRDRNSNIVSESVSSHTSNNKDNINKEMSECSSNNFVQSNTNNKAYSLKTLLEKLKRKKQMDSMNSSFLNTSESSSSEQIPLSPHSCNTSDDTIISSHDEQVKESDVMDPNTYTIVKEPASEKLSKKLTVESHSDSEGTRDLSSLETDSIASSNVDDTKRRLNQSMENDSAAFSNAENSKQHQSSDFITPFCNINGSNHQLTTIDQTLDVSKLTQQMLKIVQNMENNSELDSDDLSQESLKDDKNDESKGDISNYMSEMTELMNNDANMIEKAFTLSDCDEAFDDSEWDAGVDPSFLFYLAKVFKQAM
ncbi:Tudor domain-containing protein 5 [Trachymyrmex septentrionalis]|uniref:Tudor domain-containing protein 5 n=1 Tax=Trachymyrmex septentrionalis TaxID=34720 RepID=A0A195F664_9HYME|nr:Tudor domain-containing protein 5 [Trachymyrmex septentrionalis]